ncbi:MAG: hypothetical protein HQM08_25340 [Candidatus Riflebacteria bacterium]|nr:hypothetical protein [Candidatus Riflebacteria bacterium]
MGGQGVIDGESAETSLLYGSWPGGGSAPTPLAAGAWAALATQAVSFVRHHLSHPDSANIFIANEKPTRITLIPAEPFAFPSRTLSEQSVETIRLVEVRGLTIEQRLDLAAELNATALWKIIADAEDNVSEALLLAGWLASDDRCNESLLGWVLDNTHGPVAEEGLAVRIVLGTADPGLRRHRLLGVTEAAYARRLLLSSRVFPTPYDNAAPIEQLQAGAVQRLTTAGRIDQACELSTRCSVPPSQLGGLRENLIGRILDRTVPANERLHLVGYSKRIFPDLVGKIRLKNGLACDPLPTLSAWSMLDDSSRGFTSLTIAPEAVRSALATVDVSVVVVALEVTRKLAFLAPEEGVGFSAEVLALCHDKRIEPRLIQTRLCARARDVHSLIFAALGGVGAWEALNEVINAMLSVNLGVSLGMHFRGLSANKISVEQVGALLVRWVADHTRPVEERLQAREALSVLAAEGAAVHRNQPLPSPEGRVAARKTDDLLITVLTDPTEPEDFKSAIRNSLTRWMPDRIPSLQKNIIARETVPSITALQPGQSIAGIDRNEVLALLRDPEAAPSHLLGAIALSEPFIRMTPDLAVELESLLRARIADFRRLTDRGRVITVAVEAHFAHRSIWRQLKPSLRPSSLDLRTSLCNIAEAQEAPAKSERSLAAALAETVTDYLTPTHTETIAAGLKSVIADRKSSAWTRLHAFHALSTLRDQRAKADKMLFTSVADPSEDPVLRTEAHPLLASRLPQQVYDLQTQGLLPRPPIPPVNSLFHNLPCFERDTEGEWVLTPEAMQLGNLVYPDDLITTLRDSARNPARACAAAALAPLVAQRLPALAGLLTNALQSALSSVAEINVEVAGRTHTFRLNQLCTEGLRTIGVPQQPVDAINEMYHLLGSIKHSKATIQYRPYIFFILSFFLEKKC